MAPDEITENPTPDSDAAPPSAELVHGYPVTRSRGQRVVHVDRGDYLDLVRALHSEGYLVCVDVTAVDYLTHPGRADLPDSVAPERFELVVNLLNHAQRARLRLRVQVPESDPVVPSLFDVHPGSEALEREVYDLFGIEFEGHPDLTRILLPEDWEGHPLRKDESSGRIPVQFKGAPAAR
jgi:NADH-quinone oxidoreductase subunit C